MGDTPSKMFVPVENLCAVLGLSQREIARLIGCGKLEWTLSAEKTILCRMPKSHWQFLLDNEFCLTLDEASIVLKLPPEIVEGLVQEGRLQRVYRARPTIIYRRSIEDYVKTETGRQSTMPSQDRPPGEVVTV